MEISPENLVGGFITIDFFFLLMLYVLFIYYVRTRPETVFVYEINLN